MNTEPIPSVVKASWCVQPAIKAGWKGLQAHSPDGSIRVEVEPGEGKGKVHVSFSEYGVQAGALKAVHWADALLVAVELVKRVTPNLFKP